MRRFFSGLRGVNLGGWLVLEKWMTPDTYDGTDAEDEYNLCLALGDKAKSRLDGHRETFITASDFQWIKNCRPKSPSARRVAIGRSKHRNHLWNARGSLADLH